MIKIFIADPGVAKQNKKDPFNSYGNLNPEGWLR
jgi:hypothetical protein